MKNGVIFLWCFMIMVLCNSCETDGGINNPAIPDPEGTVVLDMTTPTERIDGRIYLEEGNFNGALFATVGKVRGLGDVKTIPTKGWANKIAAIEEHGYIAYSNNQYWRLFVSTYNNSITSTIRAVVKFQRPFLGSEKEIKLKTSTVTVDGNLSNYQTVEFTNGSLFPYTVTIPQTANWCTAFSASSDNLTPPNTIRITAKEKNLTLQSRECIVTVKSDIGKEVPIKVIQAGGESWITVEGYNGKIDLYYTNSYDVQIKSNDQWTAASNANWCTVSPKSGNGNGTITISATTNPTGTSRNATITLTTKDNKAKAEVKVVQPESNLYVSTNNMSFSAPASQSAFTVNSNISSWTVSSNQTWCTVSKSNNTVTVSVSENLTGTDRSAVVTVAVSEELKATVNITQYRATLSTSKANISFAGTKSDDSFTVSSNISTWTVSSNQAWCTVAKNNNQVTVSATENLSGAVRTATITVSVSANQSATVSVTQAVPTLSVSKTALNFPKTPTNNETFTVTSNVSSWNVVSNQSWCNVSKNGNNVTVSASQNTTKNTRSATVTVSLPNDIKTITVSQGAYEIGDYYNINGVKGIVYKMIDLTRGMIVSLDETQAIWSSVNFTTGATSNTDGLYNMERIKLLTNWSTNYPAFVWCNAKNTGAISGWYLPAINELNDIFSVYGRVNDALSNNGGILFSSNKNYWSSTEYYNNRAYYRYYQAYTDTPKTTSYYVRAVKAF